MLATFYPAGGPDALARARRERPAYFAGGTLTGPTGEQLRLPDGRVFDFSSRLTLEARAAAALPDPIPLPDETVESYLLRLLNGGFAPQPAIDQANAHGFFGLAKYYPQQHIIGLPLTYLLRNGSGVWVAVIRTEVPGGAPDPFALEPGPVDPLDEEAFPPPTPREIFGPLVDDAVAQLGDTDGVLLVASNTVAEESSPDPVANAYAEHIDGAWAAIGEHEQRLNDADPSTLIDTTNSHDSVIAVNDANYDQPPPDSVAEPDPGQPPHPPVPPPPDQD